MEHLLPYPELRPDTVCDSSGDCWYLAPDGDTRCESTNGQAVGSDQCEAAVSALAMSTGTEPNSGIKKCIVSGDKCNSGWNHAPGGCSAQRDTWTPHYYESVHRLLAALCISRPREKAARRRPKSRIGFLLAGNTDSTPRNDLSRVGDVRLNTGGENVQDNWCNGENGFGIIKCICEIPRAFPRGWKWLRALSLARSWMAAAMRGRMRVATTLARLFASWLDEQFRNTRGRKHKTKQGAHVICRSIPRPPLHGWALVPCHWSESWTALGQSLSGLPNTDFA